MEMDLHLHRMDDEDEMQFQMRLEMEWERIQCAIVLEVHLVKDMVQLKPVKELRNFRQNFDKRNPEHYLIDFDFNCPAMMRTVDKSETGREAAANFREAFMVMNSRGHLE